MYRAQQSSETIARVNCLTPYGRRIVAVVDQINVTTVCHKRMFGSLIIKTKLGVHAELSDSDTAIER